MNNIVEIETEFPTYDYLHKGVYYNNISTDQIININLKYNKLQIIYSGPDHDKWCQNIYDRLIKNIITNITIKYNNKQLIIIFKFEEADQYGPAYNLSFNLDKYVFIKINNNNNNIFSFKRLNEN